MVDYFSIALNGFFTGAGVIAANSVWSWMRSHRGRLKKHADDMIEEWLPRRF